MTSYSFIPCTIRHNLGSTATPNFYFNEFLFITVLYLLVSASWIITSMKSISLNVVSTIKYWKLKVENELNWPLNLGMGRGQVFCWDDLKRFQWITRLTTFKRSGSHKWSLFCIFWQKEGRIYTSKFKEKPRTFSL